MFHLYPFQEDVLNDLRNNRFSIINKSRQLGISTLSAGFALWTMLFNKDKTVLCIATKQETAKGMVEKVQFMYNSLPTWLRGNQKPISDNKLSLKLANNSQIVATSAASDAGRSYAVSLLIVDEAAFIEGIDRIYTSIKPTIATGGGIIALSSPNGVGNWFVKLADQIARATGANRLQQISKQELDEAIEFKSDEEASPAEKSIMKGVVKFGDIAVKQIMRSRLDVSGVDYQLSFPALLQRVQELHYSRLPVYKGSLDEVVGILYTKDLLPYLGAQANFDWHRLLRAPYFVPEPKLIEDLLKTFQQRRIHFAVVVDEFGSFVLLSSTDSNGSFCSFGVV